LTADIVELARQYGRYGYRRITALLRRAGWTVNKKRVERIWRCEGLKVPAKQPKRCRLWLNDGSCIRLRPETAQDVAADLRQHRAETIRPQRHAVNVGIAPAADGLAGALTLCLPLPSDPADFGRRESPPEMIPGKRDPKTIRAELIKVEDFPGVSGSGLSIPAQAHQMQFDGLVIASKRQFVGGVLVAEMKLAPVNRRVRPPAASPQFDIPYRVRRNRHLRLHCMEATDSSGQIQYPVLG
jgi:hypothetical protein